MKPNKREKKKNKGGRPTSFRPEYCQMVVDHMDSGLSMEAFAGTIGVNIDTIYHWKKTIPEFSDALKKGKAKSLLYWEKMGITGMAGKIKGFNATVWIMNMCNRHRDRGWRRMDPQETSAPEVSEGLQSALAQLDREKATADAAPSQTPPPQVTAPINPSKEKDE